MKTSSRILLGLLAIGMFNCNFSSKKASNVDKAIQSTDKAITKTAEIPFTAVSVGDQFPDLDFFGTDGSIQHLSTFHGSWIFIDVWATWCKPCLEEMPHLARLEKQFADENIVFAGISTDFPHLEEKWKGMVATKELPGVQLFAGYNQEVFEQLFKIQYLPRYIIVDPLGQVVELSAERPSDPLLVDKIQNLLTL